MDDSPLCAHDNRMTLRMYECKQSVDHAPDSEREEAEERGKAQMQKHFVLHRIPPRFRESRSLEHLCQHFFIEGMQMRVLRCRFVAVNAKRIAKHFSVGSGDDESAGRCQNSMRFRHNPGGLVAVFKYFRCDNTAERGFPERKPRGICDDCQGAVTMTFPESLEVSQSEIDADDVNITPVREILHQPAAAAAEIADHVI